MVCASPDYFKRFGRPVNEADLKDHRLIGMRSNPSQRVFAWEFADAASPQPRRVEISPTCIMNDPESAARAASLGMGLAQVGSYVVLPLVANGQLEIVFPAAAVQSRGLYAVYPSKRFAPKKLTAFVDHLVEALSDRADLIYAK